MLVKKFNGPAEALRGRPVVCLGLAEGARPLRIRTSPGLNSSRLKPQPPHVYHYNQNFSFFMDRPPFPCIPIIFSTGSNFNMEVLQSAAGPLAITSVASGLIGSKGGFSVRRGSGVSGSRKPPGKDVTAA
jgi:hypothetical protein